MIEKLSELAEQFAALPNTRAQLTTFPSGAAALDVHRDGRLFVLEYFPSYRCFGVDEVTDENSFLISRRFVSEELEPAIRHLWQLVQGREDASGESGLHPPTNGEQKGLPAATPPKTSVR